MPLTIWNCVCLTKGRVSSVKIGLFLQEIIFITEFTDSNFLLPTFLAGSKWDFPMANLLLATVNFEPCRLIVIRTIFCGLCEKFDAC